MRLFESFRAQQSGVETRNEVESPEGKSVFNRFLHFWPLRGPPVEMTKAQILTTIGIIAIRRTNLLYTQYEKRVDYVEIFVNIVNLGVRDFLSAAQGRSPLRVNQVIERYI